MVGVATGLGSPEVRGEDQVGARAGEDLEVVRSTRSGDVVAVVTARLDDLLPVGARAVVRPVRGRGAHAGVRTRVRTDARDRVGPTRVAVRIEVLGAGLGPVLDEDVDAAVAVHAGRDERRSRGRRAGGADVGRDGRGGVAAEEAEDVLHERGGLDGLPEVFEVSHGAILPMVVVWLLG